MVNYYRRALSRGGPGIYDWSLRSCALSRTRIRASRAGIAACDEMNGARARETGPSFHHLRLIGGLSTREGRNQSHAMEHHSAREAVHEGGRESIFVFSGRFSGIEPVGPQGWIAVLQVGCRHRRSDPERARVCVCTRFCSRLVSRAIQQKVLLADPLCGWYRCN